jgi:hypothetical protein
MQPFDDMLPEERAPQYEELITLLQQAYHSPMPVVTTKQAQILSRVQARLMETDPGTSLTEDMPLPANGRLGSPPSKPEAQTGTQRPGRQFVRLLNALAAVLVVGLIIASALVLFTHRSPKVGSSTLTVSAALPFQPLPSDCFFFQMQLAVRHCPHDPFTRLDVVSRDTAGYTIALKQGYADANQVLIEYTVTKEANHQPTSTAYLEATLQTQNGITLRGGTSVGSPLLGVMGFDFEPATIMPTASTRTLSLHLIIHGMNAPVASSKPFRPVTFDFSLPFHSSRAVIMQQTVTVAGKSVTLTQGVATPSETRFYLYSRDVPLDQGNNFSLMDNGRNVNGIDGSVGGITNQDGYLTNPPNQPITTEIVDFEPLFESHAVGVLTVNAPPGSHAGPWIFHFTVQ